MSIGFGMHQWKHLQKMRVRAYFWVVDFCYLFAVLRAVSLLLHAACLVLHLIMHMPDSNAVVHADKTLTFGESAIGQRQSPQALE